MAKITDPDSLVVSSTEGNLGVNGNIWLDTTNGTFELAPYGDLVAKDGVTGNALWAKFVDLWTSSDYNKYPFPMNIIDARSGQYIFGQDPGGSYNGWVPEGDVTRRMIRDAGWNEYLADGTLDRVYVGMVALASGFPSGAQFYYQVESDGAAADFTYDDAPNEAILVFEDGGIDSMDFFKLFCREASYLYDDAVLGDVGETGTGAYKVALPIAVGADLNIADTDAGIATSVAVSNATWVGGVATYTTATQGLTTGDFVVITGMTPAAYNVRGYCTVNSSTEIEVDIASNPGTFSSGGLVKTIFDLIKVRYFASAFNIEVDSGVTNRDFGIVIDAGSHSGVDGSAPGSASVLTSAAGGMTVDAFIGGTLTIHEGTDKGVSFPITDNDATTITVTGTIASGSGLSFTAEMAVPIPATLPQIYTKIQYLLRQDSNINTAATSVNGKTAGLLLNFVGSSLKCGFYTPTNPAGGGTGVIVMGLQAADVNSIVFYDNLGTDREYPYQSVGTLNFNSFLTSGGAGYYRMYFTTNPGGNYGESSAITVDDASGADIEGLITSASIAFTFDYTGNVQGGRSGDTDAAVTVVAGNAGYAKPVVATGTINESKAISITLTAEQDRGYIA